MGREILTALPANKQRLVESAFNYWRSSGFPYSSLTRQEIRLEFLRLSAVNPSTEVQNSRVFASTVGLRLANSFHPQMWHVPSHRHTRSPYDYFNDDEVLLKILERAPRFWPNRRCWNAQCIRSMFRIYGGGRVANFRPAAARAIIARFSATHSTVLDTSAGFGGRLLGCMTLERRYVGIDPEPLQIRGLRRMSNHLGKVGKCKISLIEACAEDYLPRLRSESVDLVFSSPPYYKVEKYTRRPTQSYLRYMTYQSWRENFLGPLVRESYRLLRSGGFMVVNVANTRDFSIADDFELLARRFFLDCQTLRLLMHSRPLQRPGTSRPYRWEPLLVFKKD